MKPVTTDIGMATTVATMAANAASGLGEKCSFPRTDHPYLGQHPTSCGSNDRGVWEGLLAWELTGNPLAKVC